MSTLKRFVSSRSIQLSDHEDTNETIERVRRPRTTVHSIIVANTVNAQNEWVQLQLSRGTWILMQPRRRKILRTQSIYNVSWKGRIKDFKMEVGKATIKEVLVQHVYMHKELVLSIEEKSLLPTHRPHCNHPI